MKAETSFRFSLRGNLSLHHNITTKDMKTYNLTTWTTPTPELYKNNVINLF